MMFLILFAVFGSAMALDPNVTYENRPGHCDPLREEILMTLAIREISQLRNPQPQECLKKKTLRYHLYTRLNPNRRQILIPGDLDSLRRSNFNPNWPIRISLHGWTGRVDTCSNAALKDAYMYRGNFNVILVDWSDYAEDIIYPRVVAEQYETARKLNKFTRFLHRATGVRYRDMYFITHSVGSHVAGIAGKLLRPERYGVIFALDASGPLHVGLPDANRLTPNDALYVESIHTNMAFFGFAGSYLAHSSFFPNWGQGQPKCPEKNAQEPEFTCDHFASLYYFAESVRNPKAFGAVRCKDFTSMRLQKCGCFGKRCAAEVFMGGEPAVPKRGVYYLSTKKATPYGYGNVCVMKPVLLPLFVRNWIYGRRQPARKL